MKSQRPCRVAVDDPKPDGSDCVTHSSPCQRTCSPAAVHSPPSSSASQDWCGTGSGDCSALKHPGWNILLRQPIISQDIKIVCTLLSCSKSFFAAFAASGGSVDVHYTLPPKRHPHQGRQLGAWLSRFGSIVRQLTPDSSKWVRRYGMSATERAVIAGLHAAAAKAPLQLQVYKTIIDGASTGDVLLALPPNHLTRLELQLQKSHTADVGIYTMALAGLTSLRKLTLAENVCSSSSTNGTEAAGSSSDSEVCTSVGSLLPAVSSLTQLTKLSIPAPHSAAAFSHLPNQLQELTFTAQYNVSSRTTNQPAMGLGHLTALTRLDCFHSLQPTDILPEHLKVIQLPSVSCVKPLLQIQQLETIALPSPEWRDLPSERPIEVADCERLKHVEIAYQRAPIHTYTPYMYGV